MDPALSVETFRARYAPAADLDRQSLRALIASVLAFYRNERAHGLDDAEGDMLLFQYGVFDWGSGPRFEIDLTRQFTEIERDDDEFVISQFKITRYYDPVDPLAALGRGNRWCADLSGLDEFAIWVEQHPALKIAEGLEHLHTEVEWERV